MDMENLEYELVEFAEGRLSVEEAGAVERLLKENAVLREEMELYRSCPKVTETRSDSFPDKQLLARPVRVAGPWEKGGWRGAVAACVAGILVISLWVMMPFRPSEGEYVTAQMKAGETAIVEPCLQETIWKDTAVVPERESVCEKTYCSPLDQVHETGLVTEPAEVIEKAAPGISEGTGGEVEAGEIPAEMNPMQGVMVVQVVRDTQKVYMNGMITYQESACNTMLCKASELMKTITKEIKQVPIDFINKNFIN